MLSKNKCTGIKPGVSACESIDYPVNLGNPNEFTIMELAKLVLKITGSKSKIVYKQLPVDDPRQRQPDIAKARRLLSWEPAISLQEGLKRTISWFRG
jgi:nucleoside-diphosphate-sugar epimerase